MEKTIWFTPLPAWAEQLLQSMFIPYWYLQHFPVWKPSFPSLQPLPDLSESKMGQYQTKSIFWSDSPHYQRAAIVRVSFVTPGDPAGQWWEKLLFEEEKHVISFLV